jgi:heme/copper-type cytochrome/quinol oxidase subunit 2
MDQESILYTTLTLFAVMAVLVVVVFTLIIWMVVRKGRKAKGSGIGDQRS